MAGELKGFSSTVGSVFVAFNAANQVWNGAAFENWNDSNIATYAIVATQLGTSRWWKGDAPSGTVVFLLLSGAIALPLAIADRGNLAIPNAAAGASNGLWTSDGSNNRITDSVTTVTGNVNGHVVTVSGNVQGNVVGSVGSVTGNVGGNVLGFVASGMEGDILGNLQGSVQSVTNPASIVTGVWNALLTALTTAGSIGQKLANAVFVGGFTGPSSVTLTFHDSLGAAVPNVEFTIIGQGSGRADSNGQASFGMNDGTYTVVSNVTNGRIFPNATLVVSGTTAMTITGSSVSIPPAPSPSQATVYAYVHAGSGTLTAGKVFYLRMTKANTGTDIWIKDAYKSNPSDSGGLATATAEIGATYQVSPNGAKWSDEFIVTSDPFHLTELVGNGWT